MAQRKARKRGFGNTRKLPSGRWQARFTGPDGVEYKGPRTFALKLDAEAWLTDRRREIDRGLWNPAADDDVPEAPLFGVFADEWLRTRTVAGRRLKLVTRQHYRLILDGHLIPEFGDKRLDEITAEHVRGWHAELLPEANTMRTHVYSLLRTILNSAVESGLVAANPCRIRGAGSVRRASKTTPATAAELAKIADSMDPAELRLMVLLAGWCALRFGELIELRRSDVKVVQAEFGPEGQRPAAVISIRRAAVYDSAKKKYVATTPKSDAGVRDVHVPPHIVGDVVAHLATLTGVRASARLFEHPETGGYLTPSRLYRSYFEARAAAGREDLRFHDLRHTGATLAAVSGASLAELQARLGHSTVGAAMRYQHAVAVRDEELAARMSALAAGDDD